MVCDKSTWPPVNWRNGLYKIFFPPWWHLLLTISLDFLPNLFCCRYGCFFYHCSFWLPTSFCIQKIGCFFCLDCASFCHLQLSRMEVCKIKKKWWTDEWLEAFLKWCSTTIFQGTKSVGEAEVVNIGKHGYYFLRKCPIISHHGNYSYLPYTQSSRCVNRHQCKLKY